jgi:hypothetical protein
MTTSILDNLKPVTVTLTGSDWDTVRVALVLYQANTPEFAKMVKDAYRAVRRQTTD